MGLFSSEASVKISEKTGGAYADMSDVVDHELNDIFGSDWTAHDFHYDSCGSKDGDTTNNGTGSNENGDKEK